MGNADGSVGTPPKAELARTAQANIGRAARFADDKPRDWNLFVFFRILSQAEFDANMKRLARVAHATAKRDGECEYLRAITHAGSANAGLAQPRVDVGESHEVAPAQAFLNWLTVLLSQGQEAAADINKTLDQALDKALGAIIAVKPGATLSADEEQARKAAMDAVLASRSSFVDQVVRPMLRKMVERESLTHDDRTSMIWLAQHALKDGAVLAALLEWFEENSGVTTESTTPRKAGRTALKGGLFTTMLYEFLRQLAPTHLPGGSGPAMRPEAESRAEGDGRWDPFPVNYAFTFSGLKALNLCKNALSSFPEPFKEGMAARATRIGDTGPSAPENWDSVLGLPTVHGYFTGGFIREPEGEREEWRRALRDDVRAFNDRVEGGDDLRTLIGAIMAPLGLEVVHIELGEDCYDTYKAAGGAQEPELIRRRPYRIEHFGFRDGISQPFVDMSLSDTLPGGGTPSRGRTWTPVAQGEIFLSGEDEDGGTHQQPSHPYLREGSTFLVFRKLEQDVAMFRNYLEKQRPGQPRAQDKLAAQFMGRWPNGVSLVTAPDAPLDLGSDRDDKLNDFLYAADDPHGLKCPLSSHVRRSNPRDIGGTNDVRRHRILRRSIAYGGPVLPEGSIGDGEKRGLLFVCANARIDLQFELIQADWLNRGEILGQAGLNRCPISGNNDGGPADAFFEPGAGAPMTHLPRFVVTRGGDYFFAPGLEAIRKIASGYKFQIGEEHLPFGGRSFGDASTPILFEERRLKDYAQRILTPAVGADRKPLWARGQSAIRVETDNGDGVVAFVARHAHVDHVLGVPAAPPSTYSMEHYRRTVRGISGSPEVLLAATEPGPSYGNTRTQMTDIFESAWGLWSRNVTEKRPIACLEEATKKHLDMALRRTGPSRRIDVLHDLGTVTAYNVMGRLFGTPGPKYLTELSVALQFAQPHVATIEPEWLKALRGEKPDDVGLASWQLWSILLGTAIGGNVTRRSDLQVLAMQAGREFLTTIDIQIAEARKSRLSRGKNEPTNLLEAMVAQEADFVGGAGKLPSLDAYYALVRMLLLEASSSALFIPTTLGQVVDTLFHYGIDLAGLLEEFRQQGGKPFDTYVEDVIFETCRLRPSIPLLTRVCAQDETFDDEDPGDPTLKRAGKLKLKKGDFVVALLGAAGMDPRVFSDPRRLSFGLPGDPVREREKYVLFGATSKRCRGRDRIALYVLRECLKTAGRLQGLRPIPGEAGKLKKLLGSSVGLKARFVEVR